MKWSHYPGGWRIMKWKSLPRRVGNNEVEVTTQEGRIMKWKSLPRRVENNEVEVTTQENNEVENNEVEVTTQEVGE